MPDPSDAFSPAWLFSVVDAACREAMTDIATNGKILIFIVLGMNKLWGILNTGAFNAQLDQALLENRPENYGIR